MEKTKTQMKICPVAKKCGGCEYIEEAYEDQLLQKQKYCEKLLGRRNRPWPAITKQI